MNYMAVERHCSLRTATEYCRDVERFAKFIAPKKLRKAKAKDARAFINSLMEDGSNQPQSAHRKIAALVAYYKWAIREKIVKRNPMDGVEKPKAGKPLPKCMTEADVKRLLEAGAAGREPFYALRDKAMLAVLYGSGLRRAELTDLDLGDIDFTERQVHVRHGKGDKARVGFLSDDSIAALKAWLEVRPSGSEALFTKTNGKRLSPRQLWVVFRQALNAAGIKANVVPHSLRHSFATNMLTRGADLMTVKNLLGHSSVATTQTYTNVSIEHMRSQFEKAYPRSAR